MFSSEKNYSTLVIPDYRESEDSVLQACWMVFAPQRLESDAQTGQNHTDRLLNNTTPLAYCKVV